LIEDIVLSGAPYSEIVTSPTLRVNQVSARVWGAEFDDDGPEWQPFTPEDGRPPWGILSDGAVWIRHVSNGNNYQRARANMVANTLLCENFLTRDIPLGDGIDLSDDAAVADAVNNDPACSSCHQSLDPLGGFIWGFLPTVERTDVAQANQEECDTLADLNLGRVSQNQLRNEVGDATLCYPIDPWIGDVEVDIDDMDTTKDAWNRFGLRPPGYFGLGSDQGELGPYISEDPRFNACTVKRFYSYLTQTDPDEMPIELQDELLEVFESSDLNASALAKAIVLSDPFTATELDGGVVGLQVIRPEQYGRLIDDLTGFQWRTHLDAFTPGPITCGTDGGCIGTADLSASDRFGFRTMGGGMDGYRVTTPTHEPTPNRLLVNARFASEAAGYAVDHNFEAVLTLVSPDTDDEGLVRDQLVVLHARALGEVVAADSEQVSESYGLFTATLDAGGDPSRAWKLVLTAMLQDTSVMFY